LERGDGGRAAGVSLWQEPIENYAISVLRVTTLLIRPQSHFGGTDGFLISRSEQLASLALRYRIPSIFQYRAFAIAGGSINYGSSFSDTYYQLGLYTGRLLKGEKPADLPVQQSTKVELIINLKTAKMLGITVPLPLSGRADEVIE
jgi:putative tryptophan/tyrosine transport system substrate-binding protein